MDDLLYQVRSFVAEQTGSPIEQVRANTTLFGGLGIDGDDAWDLMEGFSKKFEVDIAGYCHQRYFGDEGLSLESFAMLISGFLAFVTRSEATSEELAGRVPIRKTDLVTWARNKRWSP